MDIPPGIASIIVALLGILGSYLAALKIANDRAVTQEKRFMELQAEIGAINLILETKLNPIWNAIMKELPKLLISPHTPRADELIRKFTNGYEAMSRPEKEELLVILDTFYATIHSEDTAKSMIAVIMSQVLREDLDRC